ncbi:MAG: hypothetical protein ACR2RV_09445, partial [Verrucomicrobiales bacterium]
ILKRDPFMIAVAGDYRCELGPAQAGLARSEGDFRPVQLRCGGLTAATYSFAPQAPCSRGR